MKNWKKNLVEVENADKDSLLSYLLKDESVLLSKNESSEKIQWITDKYNTVENIGEWKIFYNK